MFKFTLIYLKDYLKLKILLFAFTLGAVSKPNPKEIFGFNTLRAIDRVYAQFVMDLWEILRTLMCASPTSQLNYIKLDLIMLPVAYVHDKA